ncbi:MAG: acyl-CoA dehydrogenase family protein [Deltaproteobacteria bacterium]|nr:acyl-CoA dehydrogenase family protein [Deltaproteobacteria bacterium]MBW2420660.1 acyl-CoA dehydrogenase family protein [Deltaproteobacteria bacterium]
METLDANTHSFDEYSFDGYLAALGEDWLREDPLLGAWLQRSSLDASTVALVARFGRAAATRYKGIADRVEQAERLPFIERRGPYNRESAEVVLPAETRAVLAEVHGSGIWREGLDERVRYALVYLLNQNGEFGVTCSTACTDGLVRLLRAFGDDPRSREVVDQLERATPENWIHGAQFVSEIQGGSDAATNVVRAEPAEAGLYSLTGQKWFCSNLTADYWLVTARAEGAPAGHRGVGLFCVPRLYEGRVNGHRILRLKDKLGTRALPTAELELDGALGWPVGPQDAGLKNMVAVVLTTSRVHNIVAAAGFARRASREARAYAGFRHAFGKRIEEQPLLAASLREIEHTADLAEAGAFAVVDTWAAAQEQNARAGRIDGDQALWARVLVSIAKAVATRRAPGHVYAAMMVFGGNGIEERFCALPRLWRDAAILETWEGPYTLLLMQALRDMVRFGVKGRERAFLELGLAEGLEAEDWDELEDILAAPDQEENILRWGRLAPRLYQRFEETALAELRGDVQSR